MADDAPALHVPDDVPERSCHTDAGAVLRARGVVFLQILRVDPDAILYLTPHKEPKTAWLRRTDSKLEVTIVAGFPAHPEL